MAKQTGIKNKQPLLYDVIVIGSGPAGCAAAIACLMQGLHTLIITSQEENAVAATTVQPSESIHPGVVSLLASLKAAHCIDAAVRGIYEGVEVNGIYSALGGDENGAWQGYHINRTVFDAALLAYAMQQGAEVRYNLMVTDLLHVNDRITGITTNTSEAITCRYVIDASGQKRTTGKKAGFKEVFYSPPLVTWTGVCAGHSLPHTNRTYFVPHTRGWTWLAPATDGSCTFTRLELKGKQALLPPTALNDYPLIGKINASNRRWRAYRPVCKEGLLLCGDAAGIIDPAAGQGILNAILSAVMAVKTITSCMSRPEFEALHLAKYDDWHISNYTTKVQQLKQYYQQHGIAILNEEK